MTGVRDEIAGRRVRADDAAPPRHDVPARGRCSLTAIAAALTVLATEVTATTDEWRNLHARCDAALTRVAALDTDGLIQRPPTLIPNYVDQPPFGRRVEYDVLRLSARTVPTGIWTHPGGRFEMTLIEYPTRPGTRAICEVQVAHGAPDLTDAEAAAILAAFRDTRAARIDAGAFAPLQTETEGKRAAMVSTEPNPRGCPVVASVSRGDGFFRSSVAERAGTSACGGASLMAGLRALQMGTGERMR